MRYFDKKVQQAEEETTKLINEYADAFRASNEAKSIKSMMDSGTSSTAIVDRAFRAHRALFSSVMAGAPPKMLKDPRRVLILEQFCLQFWGRMLGENAYRTLIEKSKQPKM